MGKRGVLVYLPLFLGILGGFEVKSQTIYVNHQNAIYQVNISGSQIETNQLMQFDQGLAANPFKDLDYDLCNQLLCVLHSSGIICSDLSGNTTFKIAEDLPGPEFIPDVIQGIEFCQGILYFNTDTEIFKANDFTTQKGVWSNGIIQEMKVDCNSGQVFIVTTDGLYVSDCSLTNSPVLASSFVPVMNNVRLGLSPQNDTLLILSNSVMISTFPLSFDPLSLPRDIDLLGTLSSSNLMAGISGSGSDIYIVHFFGSLFQYMHPDDLGTAIALTLIDNAVLDRSSIFICDSSNDNCMTAMCGSVCDCCNGICSMEGTSCTCGEIETCTTLTSGLYGNDTCALQSGNTFNDFSQLDANCTECTIGSNSVEHGNYTYSTFPPYLIGTTAMLQCDNGYEVTPDPCTLSCNICKEFVNDTCSCPPVDCGNLTSISQAIFTYDTDTTFGSTATFTCSPGFPSGERNFTCIANGTWSGPDSVCLDITCDELIVSDGVYVYNETANTAALTCNYGYEANPPFGEPFCNGSAWDIAEQTCRYLSCPELADPSDGYIMYSGSPNRGLDSLATYHCDTGYTSIDNVTIHTCQSNETWTGVAATCDDVDECATGSADCMNDANCTNTNGSFTCMCAAGWNGTDCGTDIDECAMQTDDCINGATCMNGMGGFSCNCTDAWEGDDCGTDVDECATGSADCMNDANCTNTNGSFTCMCAAGWNGTDCGTDIDECAMETDDCMNGATCMNDIGGFSCICTDAWEGDDCGTDANECTDNTDDCMNDATCMNTVGLFTCMCAAGWEGADCGTDIDECMEPVCGMYGNCTNTPGSYSCTCFSDYTGPQCDIYIPKNFICAVERPYQYISGTRSKRIEIHSLHYGIQKDISKLRGNEKPITPPEVGTMTTSKRLKLPKLLLESRFGPFRCASTISGQERSIFAATQMAGGAQVTSITKTICVGGQVNLEPVISFPTSELRWKFNSRRIDNSNRKPSIVASVEGIYEAFRFKRYPNPHAIWKVNVIDCNCTDNCTMNGGQCDANGDCCCPPGQTGEFCENTCLHGKFGTACQWDCGDEFGIKFNGCKRILFCYEEPLGCLCYGDFQTPRCT